MITNQTVRVLELLKRFNDGKMVKISELKNDALWEGKSEKTIRRDLDVIKQYFPDGFACMRGESGAYRAVTKDTFENFLDAKTLSFLLLLTILLAKISFFLALALMRGQKKP